MPSCVMRYCTNYTRKSTKSDGVTYHSFPLNEKMRIKWLDIVCKQRREPDWQPTSSSRVCSKHFKDDDKYSSKEGRTFLKKTALPFLELHYSSARNSTIFEIEERSDSEMSNVLNPTSLCEIEVSVSPEPDPASLNKIYDVEILNSKSPYPVIEVPCLSQGSESPVSVDNESPNSPNSFDNEEVSDIESISETPNVDALKKRITRLVLSKEKLINRNRNLGKRIKRLKKKVEKMRAQLKELKPKPPRNRKKKIIQE